MVHFIYINKGLTNKHLILSFFWSHAGEGGKLDTEDWHVIFLISGGTTWKYWTVFILLLVALKLLTMSPSRSRQINCSDTLEILPKLSKVTYLRCFFHWWPANCSHSWLIIDLTGRRRADPICFTKQEEKLRCIKNLCLSAFDIGLYNSTVLSEIVRKN